MTQVNRRQLIGGSAAVAATGWAQRSAQAAGAGANLFDVLEQRGWLGRGWRFIGADGKEIDIGALRDALREYYTTAYVGFVGCDQYCPLTNRNMAELSAQAAQRNLPLKHVIINAVPQQQGIDVLREATLEQIELTGLKLWRPGSREIKDADAIVLFATSNGRESGLNNALVPQISQGLGNRTRLDSATDHSPMVNVYAPGGAHAGRAMGTMPDVMQKLLEAMDKASGGRGR